MGRLSRLLFSIPPSETSVARRGFEVASPAIRSRLEAIGQTFVAGYHAALEESRPASLARRLEGVEHEDRGFAYEGAAMGLALTDALAPWRHSAWRAFLAGPGAQHIYMLHVGAGWALARLDVPVRRVIGLMDPLFRGLAFDGLGFHEGYFRWDRFAGGGASPAWLAPDERSAFDQGLGRSLWFVMGTDPARIARAIDGFTSARRDDLWSGVGLACAYAGGMSNADLEVLCEAAAERVPWLAQGAAFAAKARARAGNPAAHTEAACRILCGLDSPAAATVSDEALRSGEHDYQAWRRRVRDHFARTPAHQESACLP